MTGQVTRTVGTEYDPNERLDITEIAKRARAAIKQAKRDGRLPATMKVSVRVERFSMGQALRLTVTSWDGPVENADRTHWSEPLRDALNVLDEIGNRWNRVETDCLTDYFNARYYCTPTVDINKVRTAASL